MTTFERILSELGEGLGIDLAPGSERELLVFSTVATAPEGGFPAETLRAALELDLFGRDVAGHHLGLFAGSLLLSATLPLEGLSAEALADRILVLARLAGQLSGRLAGQSSERPAAPPPAEPGAVAAGDGFIAV